MILDAGNIVEFGKPSDLLKIKDGKLKALVDESGDKDILYKMVFHVLRSWTEQNNGYWDVSLLFEMHEKYALRHAQSVTSHGLDTVPPQGTHCRSLPLRFAGGVVYRP